MLGKFFRNNKISSIFSLFDNNLSNIHGILYPISFQGSTCQSKSFSSVSNFPKALDYESSEDIFLPSITSISRKFSKALHRKQKQNAEFIFNKFKNLNGITLEIGNHMLLACANTGNSKFAREICRFLESKELKLNEKSHALFLKSLCKDGLVEEAIQRLDAMIKTSPIKKIRPNIIMFNIILNACAHATNKQLCEQCLHMMKEQGIELDYQSYAELIRLSGNMKDYKMVEKWWRIARAHLPSASVVEHNVRIIALTKTKYFHSAMASLHEFAVAAVNGEFDPKNHTLSLPSHNNTSAVSVNAELAVSDRNQIASAAVRHRIDVADERKVHGKDSSNSGIEGDVKMDKDDVKPNVLCLNQWWTGNFPENLNDAMKGELVTVYNAVINGLGKEGMYSLASQLVSEMIEGGLSLDHFTYSAYLHAAAKSGTIENMQKIWESMHSACIEPVRENYETLIHGYCKSGNLEEAKALLHDMQDKGNDFLPTCHAYNALLQAYAHRGEIDSFMDLLTMMKTNDVRPDSCTYLILFSICSDWTNQDVKLRIEAIEADMKEEGIVHTSKTFNSMINTMGKAGMIKEIMERIRKNLHKKDGNGVPLIDTFTYNTAISACINSSQIDIALSLFDDLQKQGLEADLTTYNILIDGCSRNQKMEEAFAFADSLTHKGLNPDIVTFNTLIKVACYSGEVKMAYKLLNEMEMENSKVHSDQISYATLLSWAVFNKKLGMVEFLLERMHRRGLPPSVDVCKLAVEAYLNAKREDDAVEALAVLSHRMNDPSNPHMDLKSKRPFSSLHDSLKSEERKSGVSDDKGRLKKGVEEKMNLRELLDAALETNEEKKAAAYFFRLSAVVGLREKDWQAENSPWARRLRALYEHRQSDNF